MKKRVLVLMAMACLLLLLADPPKAAAVMSGSCGENVTWSFDESTGVVTLTGTGSTADYAEYEGQFWRRNDLVYEITEVIIEPGITRIGNNLFNCLSNLAKVSIPETVTEIGTSAFAGTNINQVTVPEGVTYISERALSGIEEVRLPSTLTYIAPNALSAYMDRLYVADVESWNRVVGEGTWAKTVKEFYVAGVKATELVIPASITEISSNAFAGCTTIEKLTVSEGVQYIPDGAFSECTGLKEVVLPDGLSLGKGVFNGCGRLERVTLPSDLLNIPAELFQGCFNLWDVVLPKGLLSIGASAFDRCGSIHSITFPSSLLAIDTGAFWDCTGLKDMRFLGNAPTIAHNAFDRVTAYALYPAGNATWDSFVKGDYAGTIRWYEKGAGDVLASGTMESGITWSVSGKTLRVAGNGKIPLDQYSGEAPWYGLRNEIEALEVSEGIVDLGQCAFYGLEQLKTAKLPEGLLQIDESTFCGCVSLVEVNIPASVRSIGSGAFQYCGDLESIALPEELTDIGNQAFYGCSALTEITLPPNVVYIAESTFSGCNNLKRVTIRGYVTAIGRWAFNFCYALEKIVIPPSVTAIGEAAFENCYGLKEIYFTGDVPEFEGTLFPRGMTLYTLYYPKDNTTWTQSAIAHLKIKYKPNITIKAWSETEPEATTVSTQPTDVLAELTTSSAANDTTASGDTFPGSADSKDNGSRIPIIVSAAVVILVDIAVIVFSFLKWRRKQ